MKKLLSIIFIAVSIIFFTACESNEPTGYNDSVSQVKKIEGTFWVCTEYYAIQDEYYIDFMDNGEVKIWTNGGSPVVGYYQYSNNEISFTNCTIKYNGYRYDIKKGDFSSNSMTIYLVRENGYEDEVVFIRTK